jgi:hypothetical protein
VSCRVDYPTGPDAQKKAASACRVRRGATKIEKAVLDTWTTPPTRNRSTSRLTKGGCRSKTTTRPRTRLDDMLFLAIRRNASLLPPSTGPTRRPGRRAYDRSDMPRVPRGRLDSRRRVLGLDAGQGVREQPRTRTAAASKRRTRERGRCSGYGARRRSPRSSETVGISSVSDSELAVHRREDYTEDYPACKPHGGRCTIPLRVLVTWMRDEGYRAYYHGTAATKRVSHDVWQGRVGDQRGPIARAIAKLKGRAVK